MDYKNFLEGKNVVLVGPAASIEGSNNGEIIDSYDVVVRLNYANINNPEDSGTKTNVIYYDGSLHNYGDMDLDYLVCSYPRTEWFFQERCSQAVGYFSRIYNHRVVDSELYNDLKISLDENKKVRPNSGLIAIVDILQSNVRSLFITGLDFYRSSYIKEHPDYGSTDLEQINEIFKAGDNGDFHDIEAQFQYFKENIIPDKRIYVDAFLEKLI